MKKVLAMFAVAAVAAQCALAADGGRTWKVVYSSAEGPQGRALQVLTERLTPHLLRDRVVSTQYVLPLECALPGATANAPLKDKKNAIIIGIPSENPVLKERLGGATPPDGGYLIRTGCENGANFAIIAGSTPESVLWGTFDFLDVVVPDLEWKAVNDAHKLYAGSFFRLKEVPRFEAARRPQTPVRSVFAWGHVIDDYGETFRAMAKARFNRAIIWNKWQVVNAKDVVECAHGWGVKVYWGFAWGWGPGWEKTDVHNLGGLADAIVDEWRRVWKPMGGDGIYFQSFTETSLQDLNGRPIAEAVTELVNMVSARIRAEAPGLDIVFGLHANSIRRPGATDAIAKTDESIEILWENCGGFPFGDHGSGPDAAFCDRILAMPRRTGLSWKAQLRLDWAHWAEPCGPYMLGCGGARVARRDNDSAAYRHAFFDEQWIRQGRTAYDFVRRVRAGARPPAEFNAVAEYAAPYGFTTHCQAELFWSTEDGWDEIVRRARRRAAPEW